MLAVPLHLRRRRLQLPAALVVLAALGSGCITRTVQEEVFDDGYTTALLRSEQKGSKPIDKGFQHPVYIADVRVAHILSRIDMRSGDDPERVPAIPLDTLFTIAKAISDSLGKADSSQEVVIQSIRRDKRWALFDRKYLTSLLCYMQDDLLYIHISRSDWEIPRSLEGGASRNQKLPETHIGKYPLDFRLVVDRGMILNDHQSVAADWRDDIFKKPTRTRVTSTGKVVRRTVLMETYEDETDYGPNPKSVDQLTPEQLRALADVEEERRRGEISEGEYSSRRRKILADEAPAP